MDTQKATLLMQQLMTQHNLYAKGWRFEYDNRKTRFGSCCRSHRLLTLSRPLVSLNTEEEVRDTILHEIAHALIGPGHGHDWTWKMKAREVGARPERCYNESKIVAPMPKYIGTCATCGVEITAYKFGKRMARGEQFHMACGKSGRITWRTA